MNSAKLVSKIQSLANLPGAFWRFSLSFCLFSFSAVAALDQTVADLIPKLSAEKVEDRYAPQMELQALALKAGRPGAETGRVELAKLLVAKAVDQGVPQPARVWIVRQLEYVGGLESVAALTALLNDADPELKECARRGLEKNAAPSASDSLRSVLKRPSDTAWQIGLIQSLGERHDASAVELIKPFLQTKETAPVAASALAKIASDPALQALWAAYDDGLNGAGDALVAGGDRLLATGRKPQASTLFNRLYFAGTTIPGAKATEKKEPAPSVQARCAALVSLASANPSRAGHLIKEALQDKDTRLQGAAVTAAVTTYGRSASANLVPFLPNAPASAKIYILRVLDPAAELRVIPLAGDKDESVRLAVIETLTRIGGEASVPVLMKTTLENSSPLQKAAVAGLAKVSGPGADGALAKMAGEGEAKSRAVAIHALADRNDSSALPALLKYASAPDASVSEAACAALGRMGSDNEVEPLGRLILDGKTPGAEAALHSVAGRAKDKTEAANKLVALAETTKAPQPQGLAAVFKTLIVLGGGQALNAISQSAANSNPEVKDAAVRALANWPDFAAAKPLIAIAAAPDTTQVHNVLALQGIVRLIKSSDHEPAAARLDAAQSAWSGARRNEEKKLVLSAVASIPLAGSAEFIKPLLKDPNFKTEAELAGVTLAEGLLKKDKPAAKVLAQAVKDAGPSAETAAKVDAILKK